jgi:hypothetical protein
VSWSNLRVFAERALATPSSFFTHVGSDRPPEPSLEGHEGLRYAAELVRLALMGDFADSGQTRTTTGLDQLDSGVAREIDRILAAEARIRLVRLVDVEWREDLGQPRSVLVDRGVVSVALASSAAGLVLLDFIATLQAGRQTGICGVCDRPFLLAGQQLSLAKRGKPVYHEACFTERRRNYMRAYRRAARRECRRDSHPESALSG